MEKRQIGKTDLMTTEIGFGGASIGNLYQACSDQDAREAIQAAWNGGIRYFDTAPEYGHGLSERRLGDALREYSHADYVLSTKIGDILYARHDVLPKDNKFINKLPFHLKYDYSYSGVMRAFEDSLQRLGLNKIDMILVHDLDPIIHAAETFQDYFKTYIEKGYKALHQLRNEGVISAIGLGVKKWEVCAEAMKHGHYDCFMLQGNYTLLEQPALDEFFPQCVQQKISVLLAGPYASGILATGAKKGAYFHHQEANDAILKKVRQIEDICAAHKVSLQAAAIQFPLKHPAIASVVIGSSASASITKNLAYAKESIPPAFWQALKSEGIIPNNAPTD